MHAKQYYAAVATGDWLTENEVVRSENLSERSRPYGVHGAGFQVDQDGSGDVFSTSSLVVVDVDSLQLKVGISMVGTSWVDTVFVWDDFPKLQEKGEKRKKAALKTSNINKEKTLSQSCTARTL